MYSYSVTMFGWWDLMLFYIMAPHYSFMSQTQPPIPGVDALSLGLVRQTCKNWTMIDFFQMMLSFQYLFNYASISKLVW